MPSNEKEKGVLAKILELQQAARSLNDQVIQFGLSNNQSEAINLMAAEAAPAEEKWTQALNDIVQLEKTEAETAKVNASNAYRNALWLLLSLG
ncbi:MAG: MCP four helix bundle domain-containing protein, partial [Bacillota bacterium]